MRLEVKTRSGWRPTLALVVLALNAVAPAAGAAETTTCRPAVITYPQADATLTNARPEIRWQPIAGASSYRVRLRSRIPEGEVIVSTDTLVAGEQFLPPRSLTDFRAIVRVVVTTGCDNEVPEVESDTRFFIDTAPLCVLQRVELDKSDKAIIFWESVENAIEYEAWFYEMPESKIADKATARKTRISIPTKARKASVAAIRPRCESGYGELRLIELE